MLDRQSKMYKLTMYPSNIPQQSVSSKRNLQVVDKFRKTCELFFMLKKINVGVWAFK